MEKQAGLLFPISSLPNKYGVGDFGKEAYQLVDKMSNAYLHCWQILPLNPLGYGNSPYQPLSSQAGDEIYLCLDNFVDEGLLFADEVTYFHNDLSFVAYQDVRKVKEKLYLKAFFRFEENDDYRKFLKENSWVESYALFRVFKKQNGQKAWTEWEDKYKYYNQEKSFSLIPFIKDIAYEIFLQYYFFKQWKALNLWIIKILY